MNDSNLLQTLGQVSSSDASEVFRNHVRGLVRQMIADVMAAEVTELCGVKHKPTGGDIYRSGNSSGRVIYEGQREDIIRPRVRQRNTDVGSSEVPLATYNAASCPAQLRESIVTALAAGVSTRDVAQVQPASPAGFTRGEQVQRFSVLAIRGPQVRRPATR